ncbi:MAG: Aspartate carbamoyltransferase regulatory chain [Candidatus Magasanikbacteria bacterium GW2011_GWA2_45_39]|uniref:Aspartate carbamoyltransferase regulatory chain n=2 Tax=Candidatus Magasanikiibacteriota TaxID=1752731 RepID=A0A0G1Q9A8_9BACT|nr:MAG: Aspartate carbamoyltransferase regulatory chain [Candidatus Magasanikbacteria bacterium GW2011_GWA2_45_39]KKU14313.1 MAG: Aspartate carbamoyltransferase regulatory chain [Candidatus Magasanikbacteria bacterium GW2011_GWC2_45_8]HBW74318.1 aspartate carbamoyltransferase regulatory subunit [Candidatus Magasanikbacteria bacterium]
MTAQTNNPKEIRVQAIKNGTVIDHLPAGFGLLVIKLLGGMPARKIVTLGTNLKSYARGTKDLIKIEDRELTKNEVDKIALIAPNATINIVRDYRVIKKIKPHLPETIKGAISCPNPRCITNHEAMTTMFHAHTNKKQVAILCHYCEKQFSQEEMVKYI